MESIVKNNVVSRCCNADFSVTHVASAEVCRACNLDMPHAMGGHLHYFTCKKCEQKCDVKNDIQVPGSGNVTMTTTFGPRRELSSATILNDPSGSSSAQSDSPGT